MDLLALPSPFGQCFVIFLLVRVHNLMAFNVVWVWFWVVAPLYPRRTRASYRAPPPSISMHVACLNPSCWLWMPLIHVYNIPRAQVLQICTACAMPIPLVLVLEATRTAQPDIGFLPNPISGDDTTRYRVPVHLSLCLTNTPARYRVRR